MKYDETIRILGTVVYVQVEDLDHGPQLTLKMRVDEGQKNLASGTEIVLYRATEDSVAAPMASVAAAAMLAGEQLRASIAKGDLSSEANRPAAFRVHEVRVERA